MFRTHLTHRLLLSLVFGLAAIDLPAQGRAIAGQVLDEAGKPVAGATVKLVSGAYPGLPVFLQGFLEPRGPAFIVVAKTDEKGRFRITPKNRHTVCLYAEAETARMSAPDAPVLPGDYRVLTLRKAAAVRGVARLNDDDKPAAGATVHASVHTAPTSGLSTGAFTLELQTTTDKEGGYSLLVPPGCTLDLEARLGGRVVKKGLVTPGSGQDFAFVSGHVLEGTVKDLRGNPVANAVVQDPYMPGCRTTSDAAGKFKLVMARNRYWLHVAHPRLAHGVHYARQKTVKRGKAVVQPARLVRLKDGTRFKARVLDKGERPLGGARVVLAGMPKRINQNGMLSRIVAWQDRLDNAGILDVSCLYKGYLAYVWVEVDGEFVELFSGDVGSGIDMGDVKLPLAGKLSGIVHLPTKMPAARGRVLLRRQFDNAPANAQNFSVALPFVEAPTDRAGRFRVEGLRPGTYDLAVAVPNRLPHLVEVQVGREDQKLRISLPEGKTIRGRLVDSENKPVPHQPIRLYMRNHRNMNTYRQLGFSMFEPITDKGGRFAFHGLQEGQLYTLYAYFRVNGQTYRANSLNNVDADAEDLELVLQSPRPRVRVGIGR